jgi:hypothetical protein
MDLNVHLIHPYGLICFLSHFEFTEALLLHGFDYVAVFQFMAFSD